MKILGIIPARGGSKAIPRKNKKLLHGKPLLGYTIEQALKSKELSDVIFTSEDKTLIKIAEQFGVRTPFIRPQEFAEDSSSSLSVIQHALKTLKQKGESYDAICLLQVTTPFRTAEFIDTAIKKFKKSKIEALVSVLKVPHQYNPHWVFKRTENDKIKLFSETENIIGRRQNLPVCYVRDGSIYLTKTDTILNKNSLYGDTLGYIENNSKYHVNIDTMVDWKLAENIAEDLSNR